MSIKRRHAVPIVALGIIGAALASGMVSTGTTDGTSGTPTLNVGIALVDHSDQLPDDTKVSSGQTSQDATVDPNVEAFPDLPGDSHERNSVQIFASQMPSGKQERLCIDVPDKDTSRPLDVWSCNLNSTNHKWIVLQDGSIRTQLDPGKCMTWPASGSAMSVDQCHFPIAASQSFKFQSNGRITNSSDSQCLKVKDDRASSGTPLISAPCESSIKRNEVFTALADPDAYLEITSANPGYAGKVWDLDGAGEYAGIRLYERNDNPNQQWFLEPVPSKDDVFLIHVGTTGYCLDPGGLWMMSWPCRALYSDTHHQFQIVAVSSGKNFMFRWMENPSLCIKASPAPGTGPYLGLSDCDDADSTQWFELQGSTKQLSNIVLFNKNSLGTLSCLSPSLISNKLEKKDCKTAEEILAATADILPNGNLRFRATGTCLDDYDDKGTRAAQYECDVFGKINQRWTVTMMAPPDFSPIDPLYAETPVGLESGSPNRPYLSQDLMSGEFVLHEKSQIDSSNVKEHTWLINAQDYISECINNQHSSQSRDTSQVPDVDVIISELETLISRYGQLDTLMVDNNALLLEVYTQQQIDRRREVLAEVPRALTIVVDRLRETRRIDIDPLWEGITVAQNRMVLSSRALRTRFARGGLERRLSVRQLLHDWEGVVIDGDANIERIMIQLGNPYDPGLAGNSIANCTAASMHW